VGTSTTNYWNNGQAVAFSRGNGGFFAMAQSGFLNETLQTGENFQNISIRQVSVGLSFGNLLKVFRTVTTATSSTTALQAFELMPKAEQLFASTTSKSRSWPSVLAVTKFCENLKQ
jgi:hypothetical protein